MRMRTLGIPVCSGIVLVALAFVVAPAGAASKAIEKYQAIAMATAGGARGSTVEINIYRWSTDEEREELLQVIKDSGDSPRGNRDLAKALRGQPKAGYMFFAGQQGWPIRYSREMTEGGKRQIILATDRPVSFREVYQHAYIGDFDVSVVMLRLDASGAGEGVLSVGTEVKWNAETERLEVTNVSSQPIKLTSVRKVE